ncbi:protein tyrosine phosphatase receptor type Na isoform 1-T1 [Synchiropus picturatus]
MQQLRAWRALLLLTVVVQAALSEKYGCLFERTLCSRDQFCSDDGLFGQCLSSKQDRVQYQVSVAVLRRMQDVLKQLMQQGLSWQDKITQYILSKELKRVPHTTHPSRPNSSSSSPTSLSKQQPSHHHTSKSGSSAPADNYLDYMNVEHPQSLLQMQTASIDPYTYRQHRYQDEVERSLIRPGGGYGRPSSWSQPSQRERDRQMLQEALSLYLSPDQPSYRHRGTAAMVPPGLPYYDVAEMEMPVDYVGNYPFDSKPAARQQNPIPNKAPQFSSVSGNTDGLLDRMSGVLQKYGISPSELSQEQLYELALILQLLQTQDKAEPTEKDLINLKEIQMSKVNTGSKAEKVLSSGRPAAPQATPAAALSSPAVKSTGLPATPLQPPQAAPGAAQELSEHRPLQVEDVGGKEEYGYIYTNQSPLSLYDGVKLLELLADKIHLKTSSFINISVVGPALTFRVRQNENNMTAAEVAAKAVSEKNFLESETGLKIEQAGVGERTVSRGLPHVSKVSQGSSGTVITLVSMAIVGAVLVVATAIACVKHHAQHVANGKIGLGPEGGAETHFDYQELCRQHMASKSSLCRQDCVAGVSSGMAGSVMGPGAGGRRGTDTSRVSSVSSQFSDGPQHSPSSTHSSTPSWSEEPAQSNMDISTGHMILAYMEDHLRNKDRLLKEWEALCSYQADPSSVAVAQSPRNMDKNRSADSLPYDHSRVKLKAEMNSSKQDYINASIIFDHDPRQPSYIATQGPLPHTVADFWQMVWENGCTVIVMMSALAEDGEKQCERYWPDEGSSLYHIYEVNLVSEHIWCKDFLVRSFYLKNVQTQETRTLTQFHLLSWPADGIPTSTRPLLDFRRKVNKCYRGRSCPIIVHCSDGTGRTGTYILIDMVLNRMAKGVKEIDIAAALEHIRDQRPGLVRTKDQFEFALTAVAEEVNAILKALPQ